MHARKAGTHICTPTKPLVRTEQLTDDAHTRKGTLSVNVSKYPRGSGGALYVSSVRKDLRLMDQMDEESFGSITLHGKAEPDTMSTTEQHQPTRQRSK